MFIITLGLLTFYCNVIILWSYSEFTYSCLISQNRCVTWFMEFYSVKNQSIPFLRGHDTFKKIKFLYYPLEKNQILHFWWSRISFEFYIIFKVCHIFMYSPAIFWLVHGIFRYEFASKYLYIYMNPLFLLVSLNRWSEWNVCCFLALLQICMITLYIFELGKKVLL